MAAVTSRANQQYKCKSLNFLPSCPDYPWCNYERKLLCSRLQNSRFFLSKSVKKSVKRGVWGARKKNVFLASLPSLALCFQPCSRPFVWLLARTWIRKNMDCFAVYLCSEVCSLKCCQLYPSIYISQIAVQSLQNGTQWPNNNRNYYDYDYYLFIHFGCSPWRIHLQQNLTILTNPRWMCCLIVFTVSLLPLLSLCSQCDL